MKKAKGLRFEFAGDSESGMSTTRHGRIRCYICEARFKSPHLEVAIDGFTICPSCIQAGPSALAVEVNRVAGNLDRVARIWLYDLGKESDRIDAMNMAKMYRRLASVLRDLHSFEDLPGGKEALAVVAVLQAPADRRKRKAS